MDTIDANLFERPGDVKRMNWEVRNQERLREMAVNLCDSSGSLAEDLPVLPGRIRANPYASATRIG